MSRERGAALVLNAPQRELLVQIRREHPSASAELIVSTLEHDGRLVAGSVSPNTVRRLFRMHGLDKRSARAAARGSLRRRWQAARVNQLWHADVCHGPALSIDGRSLPLRIHALLDDHSRRIIAIQACVTERESEMLMLLVKALRVHDAPETLYLDNGATYSGDALKTMCARLVEVFALEPMTFDAESDNEWGISEDDNCIVHVSHAFDDDLYHAWQPARVPRGCNYWIIVSIKARAPSRWDNQWRRELRDTWLRTLTPLGTELTSS